MLEPLPVHLGLARGDHDRPLIGLGVDGKASAGIE
jgi:hypothetical protein